MIKLAVEVMYGKKLADLNFGTGLVEEKKLFAVKSPVFSMSKLSGVDTYLGPEMKSTGESMGIDRDFGIAFAKSQISAGNSLPHTLLHAFLLGYCPDPSNLGIHIFIVEIDGVGNPGLFAIHDAKSNHVPLSSQS